MTKQTPTNGQKVLLGVCGSIAAYKAAELVRLLTKAGHQVQVVMTPDATEFIGALTLQSLSGRAVHTDGYAHTRSDSIFHIELANWADLVLIAPATANFMAKLAHGIADNLLLNLCLAHKKPVSLAPAMNVNMWQHPATVENSQTLRERGCPILGPESGAQACGAQGDGRMLSPEDIIHALLPARVVASQPARIVITAGPTWEALDPVRGLTNISSGYSGFCLARIAAEAGHRVCLIHGPCFLEPPKVEQCINVVSALEMQQAVASQKSWCEVFISLAAVCDHRPAQTFKRKLRKQSMTQTIQLVANPDILFEVGRWQPQPFCVGFSAQSDDSLTQAQEKLNAKSLDLIVHNNIRAHRVGTVHPHATLTTINRKLQEKTFEGSRDLALNKLFDYIMTQYHDSLS